MGTIRREELSPAGDSSVDLLRGKDGPGATGESFLAANSFFFAFFAAFLAAFFCFFFRFFFFRLSRRRSRSDSDVLLLLLDELLDDELLLDDVSRLRLDFFLLLDELSEVLRFLFGRDLDLKFILRIGDSALFQEINLPRC